MPIIELRQVSYEISGRPILTGLNLEVETGENLILLGRSGSGKSTTLRLINGLLRPTLGQVLVDGRSTTEWDPIRLRRNIGYVIQESGLFPHFTVARNVGLVPALEGWPPSRIENRVDELLELVGLPSNEFAARYPRQLSGGQRQRVGIARALAANPDILLLDEPFGALDPVTRLELERQFRELQKNLKKTVIFVTHDIREALRMGTRILLLAQGRADTIAPVDEFQHSQSEEARAFLACL